MTSLLANPDVWPFFRSKPPRPTKAGVVKVEEKVVVVELRPVKVTCFLRAVVEEKKPVPKDVAVVVR